LGKGREVAGGHAGALRVFVTLTAESDRSIRPVQQDDQIASRMLDVGDFAPRNADIDGPAKLEPLAGEQEMAYLVSLSPPEPNGHREMTPVRVGDHVGCLKRRRHNTRAVLVLATEMGRRRPQGSWGKIAAAPRDKKTFTG
jgi:hypothetical protein